jgi:nucleoid-associated protein
MELHSLVVHRLDKESQGKAGITLSNNLLPVGDRETEFVTNIKQVYYNKSNPNYGIFDADAVTFPFQTMLKNYIPEHKFLSFSESAMKHLFGVIDAVPQATGGYVVFAHYTFQTEEFVMTVLLNNKKQYNINDTLSIEEILSLDIDKLDVANSVNLTRWNNNEATYLSFARGRKDISNYFKRFIGCTDQTSAKESSESLKRAFLDYLPKLGLNTQEEEDLRNRVLNYCYAQTKQKEDISLHHISSMISAEEPHLFQEFAASEDYRVSSLIKGHNKTLKTLKFYVYRSKKLTIEFDSGLVNESIFYNHQTNELRITNLHDDLRRQFANEEDPE